MPSFKFAPSGEPLPPTGEELAEADKTSAILCFTDGILEDGTPYYAYIAVKPSRYAAFKAITTSRQTMILGDYGTIVRAGFEDRPPAEVIQEMRDVYGFRDNYSDEVFQRLRTEQAAFLKQQEDKKIQDAIAMLKKKAAESGTT